MSDSSDDTSSPQTQNSGARTAMIIAVAGVVLAAIPIAWGVISKVWDDTTESSYMVEADRACAGHQPDLDALGPEPSGEDPEVYTDYLQRRGQVIRAALEDWGAVKVPPKKQEKISEAYALADSAAKEWESAAHWGSRGNRNRANHYLDESGRYATEAIMKARAAGLEVCPLGF
ncbi:hypothetical protein ACWY4P_25040 [Streptomyces sp. LZ34]